MINLISLNFQTVRNHKNFGFPTHFFPFKSMLFENFILGLEPRHKKQTEIRIPLSLTVPSRRKKNVTLRREEGPAPLALRLGTGLALFRLNRISSLYSFTGLGSQEGQSSMFAVTQAYFRNPKPSLDAEVLICLTS